VQILNENDLRDCFAMFALAGAVMAGKSRTAEEVWQIADEMMEARKAKDEAGIVAVKPRRRKS
jgi:mannose/cellobiose epimerase-like protein (N-acyl-D-glucosamine 2-epimerase family)